MEAIHSVIAQNRPHGTSAHGSGTSQLKLDAVGNDMSQPQPQPCSDSQPQPRLQPKDKLEPLNLPRPQSRKPHLAPLSSRTVVETPNGESAAQSSGRTKVHPLDPMRLRAPLTARERGHQADSVALTRTKSSYPEFTNMPLRAFPETGSLSQRSSASARQPSKLPSLTKLDLKGVQEAALQEELQAPSTRRSARSFSLPRLPSARELKKSVCDFVAKCSTPRLAPSSAKGDQVERIERTSDSAAIQRKPMRSSSSMPQLRRNNGELSSRIERHDGSHHIEMSKATLGTSKRQVSSTPDQRGYMWTPRQQQPTTEEGELMEVARLYRRRRAMSSARSSQLGQRSDLVSQRAQPENLTTPCMSVQETIMQEMLDRLYYRPVTASEKHSIVSACPEVTWLAECAAQSPLPAGWHATTLHNELVYMCTSTGTTSSVTPALSRFVNLSGLVIRARIDPLQAASLVVGVSRAAVDALREAKHARLAWTGPHTDYTTGASFFHCPDTNTSSWGNPWASAVWFAVAAEKLMHSDAFAMVDLSTVGAIITEAKLAEFVVALDKYAGTEAKLGQERPENEAEELPSSDAASPTKTHQKEKSDLQRGRGRSSASASRRRAVSTRRRGSLSARRSARQSSEMMVRSEGQNTDTAEVLDRHSNGAPEIDSVCAEEANEKASERWEEKIETLEECQNPNERLCADNEDDSSDESCIERSRSPEPQKVSAASQGELAFAARSERRQQVNDEEHEQPEGAPCKKKCERITSELRSMQGCRRAREEKARMKQVASASTDADGIHQASAEAAHSYSPSEVVIQCAQPSSSKVSQQDRPCSVDPARGSEACIRRLDVDSSQQDELSSCGNSAAAAAAAAAHSKEKRARKRREASSSEVLQRKCKTKPLAEQGSTTRAEVVCVQNEELCEAQGKIRSSIESSDDAKEEPISVVHTSKRRVDQSPLQSFKESKINERLYVSEFTGDDVAEQQTQCASDNADGTLEASAEAAHSCSSSEEAIPEVQTSSSFVIQQDRPCSVDPALDSEACIRHLDVDSAQQDELNSCGNSAQSKDKSVRKRRDAPRSEVSQRKCKTKPLAEQSSTMRAEAVCVQNEELCEAQGKIRSSIESSGDAKEEPISVVHASKLHAEQSRVQNFKESKMREESLADKQLYVSESKGDDMEEQQTQCASDNAALGDSPASETSSCTSSHVSAPPSPRSSDELTAVCSSKGEQPSSTHLGDLRASATSKAPHADKALTTSVAQPNDASTSSLKQEQHVYRHLGDLRASAKSKSLRAGNERTTSVAQTNEASTSSLKEEQHVYRHLGDLRASAKSKSLRAGNECTTSVVQTNEASTSSLKEEQPVYRHLGDLRASATSKSPRAGNERTTSVAQPKDASTSSLREEQHVYRHLGDLRTSAKSKSPRVGNELMTLVARPNDASETMSTSSLKADLRASATSKSPRASNELMTEVVQQNGASSRKKNMNDLRTSARSTSPPPTSNFAQVSSCSHQDRPSAEDGNDLRAGALARSMTFDKPTQLMLPPLPLSQSCHLAGRLGEHLRPPSCRPPSESADHSADSRAASRRHAWNS